VIPGGIEDIGMSLSDYNTLALNEQGDSITSGRIVSPQGVVAVFFKDWLDIEDESSRKNGDFVKPLVMRIYNGDLSYKDLTILAFRGPQDGVYAIAYHTDEENRERGMIGCGTYMHQVSPKKCLAWFERKLKGHDYHVPECFMRLIEQDIR
jgi:hypothetical protein